jgi:hypothetical protein
MAPLLDPIQLALSPGGPESAAHVLQAALELHPDWIIISTDIKNAFNTRKRADILSILFDTPALAPLWRLASWSYGSSSPLLVMDHGRVISELISGEGVKQGDILASFLFALSMKQLYSNSIDGLGCHAVAVMDDFYIFGPSSDTILAFDRFDSSLANENTGLILCRPKTVVLHPSSFDSKLISTFTSRNLQHTSSSITGIGSILSRDHHVSSQWLVNQVPLLHQSFFDLLNHPLLPSQHAFTFLRLCMLPRMNYWSRIFQPDVFSSAAEAFDKLVRDAFCLKLKLPSLSYVATEQLSLPVGVGGFGLRSMQFSSPAAWWSALAQAFPRIRPLLHSLNDLTSDVPFVKSQIQCYHFFNEYKVPRRSPLPSQSKFFWIDYESKGASSGLQRKIIKLLNKSRLQALLSHFPTKTADRARMVSLASQYAGSWLTTAPANASFYLPDPHFNIASRLRLGLPPVDNLNHCLCGANLNVNPLHFLSCSQLRSSITIRHDRLLQLFARTGRLAGVAVQIESHVDDTDGARTDGDFFFHSNCVATDTSVIHPSAPSFVKMASSLLKAASSRERQKDTLYLERCRQQGKLFFPLVLESFGAIGERCMKFIDLLCEEGAGNGVRSIHGVPLKQYLTRALSFCLQAGNSHILLDGVCRSRARLNNPSMNGALQ